MRVVLIKTPATGSASRASTFEMAVPACTNSGTLIPISEEVAPSEKASSRGSSATPVWSLPSSESAATLSGVRRRRLTMTESAVVAVSITIGALTAVVFSETQPPFL
ncbi:hypothetical protein D3C87_1565230 [compost metagenome]